VEYISQEMYFPI